MQQLGEAISEEQLAEIERRMEAAADLAEQTQDIVQNLQEPEPVEYTEEQKAAAVVEAQKWLDEDPELALICQTMIISRQLYWMGRIALQRRLSQLSQVPGVEECLVMNVATHGDQQRFTSQQVMHGLGSVVLAFVNGEAERDILLMNQLEQERRQAEEEANGQLWHIAQNLDIMRSKSVIAIPTTRNGWSDLAKEIIETVTADNETKGARKINIFHITDKLKAEELVKKSDIGTKHYVEVGANKMIGSCNGGSSFDKAITPWLRLFHKNRVDLILIDDINPLRVPAASWQSPVKVSEEAHRVIRKWADEHGCAVVACMPVDDREGQAENIEHLSQFVHLVEVPLKESKDDAGSPIESSGEAVGVAPEGTGGIPAE